VAPEQALVVAITFMLATTGLGWLGYALWTWASRKR
jgi:hypothetical protein